MEKPTPEIVDTLPADSHPGWERLLSAVLPENPQEPLEYERWDGME